jgi:4'-phosphopantetheinyl transferase EntD
MDLDGISQRGEAWMTSPLPCPVGHLIGARCPGQPPDAALASFSAKELEHASRLPPSRRREWFAGRLCLRTGLAACSTSRVDLLPLPSGAPCVPAGVTGSISHKRSLAIALVMPRNIPCGVDVEEIEERDAALVKRIMTPREQAIGVSPATATLHFSAKEAVYKLLPAEMQPGTDFEDIELTRRADRNGWMQFDGLVHGTLEVRVYAHVTVHWALTVATRS